jgi:uncharacterized membrane protein
MGMTMGTDSTGTAASPAGNTLARLAWALTLSVGAWFVATKVPRYFAWNEASYGDYWPRAGYLLPHVLAGLVAITTGPLQFWPWVRRHHPRFHRVTGRTYLAAIAVASSAAFVLSLTTDGGLVFGAGLFCLALTWLLTSGMALLAIRRRNFEQHRQWMVRSYVVTFAFVLFRVGSDSMRHYAVADDHDIIGLMAWISWALPLVAAEVVLQYKSAAFARRPRTQGA